jgi:hypothetical protein
MGITIENYHLYINAMAFLTTALFNQNEAAIPYGAANAQTTVGSGSFNGQIYLQIGGASQGYRRSLWLWNGSSWVCVPLSPILGSGNPVGTVTPDAIGQDFKSTTTGQSYTSTGVTQNDWSPN